MFADIIAAVAQGFLIVAMTMWVLGWLIILGLGALYYLLRRLKA